MIRRTLLCILWLMLAALPVQAAATDEVDEKGTFFGALFCPVTPSRLTSPDTGSSQGVLITHILPGSPAASAGLRRDDTLLEYDSTRIRDCEQLARLIRDDKPGRKVKLLLRRGKADLKVEVTLALGPVLKIRPGVSKPGTTFKDPLKDSPSRGPRESPGVAKSAGSASVTVFATPLRSGEMKYTIEYYVTGQRKTVSCASAAEIARTIRTLPERERNLVSIALERLREINTAKPTPVRSERPLQK
jgi:hypothetical protein